MDKAEGPASTQAVMRKRPKSTTRTTAANRTATKKPAMRGAATSCEAEAPAWLTRTSVYKRLPMVVRGQLDEAILLRAANGATLEEIASRFKLTEQYRISFSVLRAYARKLEESVRPAMAAQVVAGLLGCMPEDYRERLVAGSQVLLLSRVVQALTLHRDTALPVADLAKLASILTALARRSTATENKHSCRRGQGKTAKKGEVDPAHTSANPTKLAEAVRELYGITWPPAADSADPPATQEPHRT